MCYVGAGRAPVVNGSRSRICAAPGPPAVRVVSNRFQWLFALHLPQPRPCAAACLSDNRLNDCKGRSQSTVRLPPTWPRPPLTASRKAGQNWAWGLRARALPGNLGNQFVDLISRKPMPGYDRRITGGYRVCNLHSLESRGGSNRRDVLSLMFGDGIARLRDGFY
jgi:hypothetical protein